MAGQSSIWMEMISKRRWQHLEQKSGRRSLEARGHPHPTRRPIESMNAAKANCRAARATAAGAGRNGLAGRRPNRRARPACTAPVAGPRPPLRRFPRRWAPTTPRASETKQEDLAKAEEAKVEELVGVRLVRDKESGKPFVQYLVKWEDEYEDSWEAADDISEDLLRNYEDKWWRAVKTGEYDVVVSSPSLQYSPLSLSLCLSLSLSLPSQGVSTDPDPSLASALRPPFLLLLPRSPC